MKYIVLGILVCACYKKVLTLQQIYIKPIFSALKNNIAAIFGSRQQSVRFFLTYKPITTDISTTTYKI